MISSLYLFGLCVFTFYLHFFYRNWQYVKFSWQVKNGFWYPILPLVGNTYVILLCKSLNIIYLIQWIDKIKGFPFNLWYNDKYIYVTKDAKEMKTILNHPKCINKAMIYDKLKFFLEDSLFLVHEKTWRKQRKHFGTAFKSSILKNNVYIYYNHSCQLIEDLKSVTMPKDIFQYFVKYAVEIFFKSSTGISEHLPSSEIDKFGDIISEFQGLLESLVNIPFLNPTLWLTIFPPGKKITRMVNQSKEICRKGIVLKKKLLEEQQEYSENDKDLLELCLTYSKNDLNDDKILRQIILFSSAATDTTGNAFAFTFLLLAMHQEIQDELYKEVIEVVGNNIITHQDLPNLKYTEAVINESMRLLPIVPIVGRSCTEDINLGTKTIPKGSSVLMSIFHVHRDPQYWLDPLKFDPSRFMPENQSKINPISFLPFAAGPRDCLGKVHGLAMMKVTVANVIRSFKITSDHKSMEEFNLESCVTMKTVENPNCRFSTREKL